MQLMENGAIWFTFKMQNLFSGHSVVAYGSVDTYPAASASSGGKSFDES